MPIRDLDDPKPQTPPIPVDDIADELLFALGRIRNLFDRVLSRKKAGWDPLTRTRQPMKKNVAEITDEKTIDKAWAVIEEDAVAHYKAGTIEAFIVRFGDEKYGCEIFDNDNTIDSIMKRNFGALARYLLETYPLKGIAEPVIQTPPMIKRKPGRSKLEEAAA